MGILWGCYGDAMGILWGHNGNAMGILWGHYGDAMGTQWGHCRDIMGSLCPDPMAPPPLFSPQLPNFLLKIPDYGLYSHDVEFINHHLRLHTR